MAQFYMWVIIGEETKPTSVCKLCQGRTLSNLLPRVSPAPSPQSQLQGCKGARVRPQGWGRWEAKRPGGKPRKRKAMPVPQYLKFAEAIESEREVICICLVSCTS